MFEMILRTEQGHYGHGKGFTSSKRSDVLNINICCYDRKYHRFGSKL